MSLNDYTPGPHDIQYWYNLRTGQVEEGQQSKITELWGPFATHEDAEHAMEKARERNRNWDERKKGTW